MSFSTWGERQKSDWKPGNPTESFATSNGYTGHDQLDAHNLIHMGGRVYDPSLGRFLSADLFVQSPYDSQSFNRYSYTFNNPLSYTDPTGYRSQGPSDQHLKDAMRERTSGCDSDGCTTIGKRSSGSTQNMDFVKWWSSYANNAQDYYLNVGGFAGGVGYVAVGIADGMVGQDAAKALNSAKDGDFSGAAMGTVLLVAKPIKAADKLADAVKDSKAAAKKSADALKTGKSPNQLNKDIKQGKAPDAAERVHVGKVKGEQTHVHFKDGSALNKDGTWKHGESTLSRSVQKWLTENGWSLPK